MNYRKIYFDLCIKASRENRSKSNLIYYESHHIIPKCLGGSDFIENLVLLTAREHFLAHWLLWKIESGVNKYRMGHAFSLMRYHDSNNRYYSSRGYEEARKAHSISASYFQRGRKVSGKMKLFLTENHPKNIEITINGVIYKSKVEAIKELKCLKEHLEKFLKNEINFDQLTGKQKITRKKLVRTKKSEKNFSRWCTNELINIKINKNENIPIGYRLGRVNFRETYKLSEESKRKISISRIGKSSPMKGVKLNKESKRKISISRTGKSISLYNYKIISSKGTEFLVDKIGLRSFFKHTYGIFLPSSFKFKNNNNEIIVNSGIWKDWHVIKIRRN